MNRSRNHRKPTAFRRFTEESQKSSVCRPIAGALAELDALPCAIASRARGLWPNRQFLNISLKTRIFAA